MELGKVPPHDLEAEQAILGSMLTDKDAVISAIEVLREEDFYREDNKAIYEAIFNLYNRAEPVDIITVKSELESMGKFEQVGGLEYLAELPEKVPTTANAMKYIKIVEEKSTLRRLIRTANEIIDLVYDQTEDVEDIMEGAEKKIFNIMQEKNQKGYSPLKDILVESFTQLEELYNKKQHITGVPTGFAELDYKTAGLHGSELILIAARPAMGKTAFALNIAQNAALRYNKTVAIFSLEMSKDELVQRLMCSEAEVDSQRLRSGNMQSSDWEKLAQAMSTLSEAPIYIDDTSGCTLTDIRAKCRRLAMTDKNLSLIIIDYLQLMESSGRETDRTQQISQISRGLKILAKELNVPIIALSQLSRATEQRTDKRPIMSDLRDSGSIEQDADIVMFIYRGEYYASKGQMEGEEAEELAKNKGEAEIIIAKQRSGPVGTVNLIFQNNITKFKNKMKTTTEF